MTPTTATARRELLVEERRSPPSLRVARAPVGSAPVRRARGVVRPVAVSVGIVVASLLAVVAGHMQLASGQLQLQQLQSKVAAAQSEIALKLDVVTRLESPENIAYLALHSGLGAPAQTPLTIPSVPLDLPLGPPTLSSVPCCSLTPGR